MTVTTLPAYGQTPNLSTAIVVAAKINPFSGATGAVLLFTAGANGSLVTGINAIPRDTFAGAGIVCIYNSTDGGTTLNLISVASLAAYTYGAATLPTAISFNHLDGSAISITHPLFVAASKTLYASCTVALANGIAVNANGVDL